MRCEYCGFDIEEAGIDVVSIDSVTGFPEMMNGRVKTLHPKIHGALLGLRDNDEHLSAMNKHGIEPIDLVCVNLYPFAQTIAKPDCTLAQAIENIDIGGPSMLRSAAKNNKFVTVVTNSEQYEVVIKQMQKNRIKPDIFLDVGTLLKNPSSTIVDTRDGKIKTVRQGKIKIL